MNRRRLLFTSAAAPLIFGSGAARSHEYYLLGFKLIHPWAQASAEGDTDAPVYFRLEGVQTADRLLRCSTPYAEQVELRASANPLAPALAAINIAPADTIDYVADGAHLLWRGLKVPLQWGRSYMMNMVFERAGAIGVMVSVGAT